MDKNDPNLALNNLHNHSNLLLDDFAPYRKLTRKDIKLQSKPWINREILDLMKKHDKLLHKFCKEQEPAKKENLHINFKSVTNKLTKKKRENKVLYYRTYFEINKTKSSIIWKSVRSLVNIKNSSKNIYIYNR